MKLAKGHCPEGQALPPQAQASELSGAESPSGVGGQWLGVPEVWFEARAPGGSKSLFKKKKTLLGNKQTKQNQAKTPGSLDPMSWVAKCTFSSNKSNTT